MGNTSCTAGCGTNLGAYQRYHAPGRPTEGSRTTLFSATRQFCKKPRRGSQNKMASRLSRATAQTPSQPLELPAGLLPGSTAADRHQHVTVTQACRFIGSLVASKHGKQLKHQKFRRKAYSPGRDCAARATSAPMGTATRDPTVSWAAQQPLATPEPVAESGGGSGGKGGWKRPTGGEGSGDENWWSEFNSWWELNDPFRRICLGLQLRQAADPSFSFKLAVECGLDACIIIVVNLLARRERFTTELDFVLCQVAVSLLNDFALVYLLAPTPRALMLNPGSFRARLATLPSHVFQQAPSGMSRGYSLGQRLACFGAKAVQYGAVGLIMGTTGSSLVLGLTSLRTALDSSYQPPPHYQPVLGTGLGWLLFMAGSSNIRYNLINLAEDIAYCRFPGPRSKALSIALRMGNNVFGAHSWMQLAAWMNLNVPRRPKWMRHQELSAQSEIEFITEMPAAH